MSLPKLSFSTLACPDWSWKQLLEAAREYHYDGVEIRFLSGDTDLLEADVFLPKNHERTLTDLHKSGISIAAIASSVHFDDLDPKKLDHELQTGQAYIELCQRLGIHVLRVFGDAFPEPGLREQIIHQVTESLQSLGEFAENRMFRWSSRHMVISLTQKTLQPFLIISVPRRLVFCGTPIIPGDTLANTRPALLTLSATGYNTRTGKTRSPFHRKKPFLSPLKQPPSRTN